MDSRAAWSAAGAAVTAVAGTNAVAWATASTAPHAALPSWPAYAFGGIALLGLYVAGASLLRIWPFGALRAPREILDERIRLGRDARERIVRLGLADEDAQVEYVRWFVRTSAAVERYVPAVADEFMLAAADDTRFSGQVLLVQLINAKLAVLARARREA
jgi:hypothetical protein